MEDITTIAAEVQKQAASSANQVNEMVKALR